MSIVLHAAALSDVGKARTVNEDSVFSGRHVFAVADGLGGHRAGEVASRIAIEPVALLDEMSPRSAAGKLAAAVRQGNRAVFDRSLTEPELKGMGTTMTAVVVDDGTAHIAHVGDSRCYLLRDGEISQLSRDHSLVARMVAEGKLTPEQAESHPQRSIVTRALGAERDVDVDELEIELVPGDRLLLCSDGLTTVVGDAEIRAVAASGVPEEVVAALIDQANDRGGPDNITVVLVDVSGTAPGRSKRGTRSFPMRPVAWAAVVAAVLLGGIFGVRAWANRTYYVGIEGERVSIYRGLPVEVAGLKFSKVVEPTEVTREEVAPYFVPQLEERPQRFATIEEARRYIAETLPRAAGARRKPVDADPKRERDG